MISFDAALVLAFVGCVILGLTVTFAVVRVRENRANRAHEVIEQNLKGRVLKCPSCGSSDAKTKGTVIGYGISSTIFKMRKSQKPLFGLRCEHCGYVSLFTEIP